MAHIDNDEMQDPTSNHAMTDHTEKKCPECGQMLRFPTHIGGLLMACPSCGTKFYSDFKLGSVGERAPQNTITYIFEMPSTFLRRMYRFFNF
jgi:uncharacterized paraquat-inducible protein A